jgi:uncharacterized membrane protein YdjX (TVP38/TMEM64 family)
VNQPPAPRRALARVVALVLGVVGLAVAVALLPLPAVPAAVTRFGPAAPLGAVLVGAALLVALVPRTPISVACGLLFGPALGATCAVAVAMLAATATFALGRWLGRDFVVSRLARRPRLGRVWDSVEHWITREGVLAVAAVRSWPLGPYGLVGYAYGTSAVRVRHYALGTLVAATPSAILYATLGAAAGGSSTNPYTFVLLPVGLVLTALVAWRTRARGRSTQVRPPR